MNKDIIKNITIAVLSVLCIGLLIFSVSKCSNKVAPQQKIEATNQDGSYHAVYTNTDINALENENQALYDQIEGFKEQINHLSQFSYEKNYNTGNIETNAVIDSTETIKEYTYSNELNDSINYILKIGSTREPNYYNLDVTVKDKFTLINKTVGDYNEISIGSQNQGQITDVTVFNKKDKTSLFKRITIGPSVVAGYDVINKRFGVTTGIGLSIKLW